MFVKKFFALKCSLLVLLCGVAMMSLATKSHAVVLITEDFDSYADGSLIVESAGKWLLQSGTLFQMQVVGGEAVVGPQDGSQSEDLRMPFAPSGTDDIYFGLDMTVSGASAFVGSDTEYFAHFLPDGTFNFNTRFDIVAANDPNTGDFSVGIASDDSTADATWATDLSFGVTYRAVARYNQVTNIAQLWIDPTGMLSTSITGDNKANPGDVNSAFALRQSSSSFGETILIDNIIIGTSMADARGIIPEPASLVLMFVGLAGMLTRRRM